MSVSPGMRYFPAPSIFCASFGILIRFVSPICCDRAVADDDCLMGQ